MDIKTEFFVKLGIAVTVGIGFAAIVYSQYDAAIYFWACTSSTRECILLNAVIFFFVSTLVVCGLLYIPNFIMYLVKRIRGVNDLQKTKPAARKLIFVPEPKEERGSARLHIKNGEDFDLLNAFATLGKLLIGGNGNWAEEYEHLYG